MRAIVAAACAVLCLAAGTVRAAAPVEGRPLGTNLLGEACVAVPREDLAPEPGLPPDAVLRCGAAAAGSLIFIRAAQAPGASDDPAALATAYRASRAAPNLAARMACDAGRPIGPGLYMIPCRLSDGGWPNLVVLSRSGDRITVAEGPPSNIDVLQAAGLGEGSAPRTRSQSLALLAELWGRPVSLASAADLSRFKDLLRDGRTANAVGNLAEAERLFRQALDMQTQLLGPDNLAVADTLEELALSVSNVGRFEEAAALLRRAEPIVQKSPNDADRARYASYLAYDAANRGVFDEAKQSAATAAATWRRLAESETSTAVFAGGADSGDRTVERGELAMALNLQARMAVRSGDALSANAAATEALLILGKTPGLPQWWRADVLMTLGEVSAAQGRLSAAETYYNGALVERRRLFGEGRPTIATLAALGAAYSAEGMSTSAIVTFREALKLASRLPNPSAALDTEDLIPFVAAIAAYGEKVEDPDQKQGLYSEAYAAFGLATPNAVERTIALAAERQAAEDPKLSALIDAVQSAERDRDRLRIELAHEQSLPDEDRSSRQEALLRDRLDAQTKAADAARAALARSPAAADVAANPPPADLVALRRALGDREGLLTFIVGRKGAFALLIRRSGVHLGRVPETAASLGETVRALRQSLLIRGGAPPDFDLARAHGLYQSLFGDFAGQLDDLDHLIVAAPGALASLPLGLLVTRAPTASTDYRSAAWLSQRLAITQVPSIGSFFILRSAVSKAAPPSRRLLAVADPVLGGKVTLDRAKALSQIGQACRASGPMDRDALMALPPLPETRAEVQRVSMLLGGRDNTLLVGEGADEARVRAQALADYQVLYFATHGLLPGELRCQAEPGLVLTPPPASAPAADKQNDGLLDASEIARLRLRAALVVLSACNTAGSGTEFGGESLSGLAEAFFHAGARSLVVSHWQVPSAATLNLMTAMFSRLGGGDTEIAQALREAQRKLIADERTAHPVFWAAFSVVGDGARSLGLPPEGRP